MNWILIGLIWSIAFFACVALWDVVRSREVKDESHWESVPAYVDGHLIGYQVRWSEPDDDGRYLWVGHYYAGEHNSIGWCEVAAESDARRKNRERES